MERIWSALENASSRQPRQVSDAELEAQDRNGPPSSPRPPSPPPSKRKLSTSEQESAPFQWIPAANMSQSNFEDSGVWMTRNTRKQLAQITASGDGESTHLPGKAPKGQVLPRDMARKNPNAYGGAGVGVSGGLDYGGKGFDTANDVFDLQDDEMSEDSDSTSSSYHDGTGDSLNGEYSVTTESEHTSKAKGALRAQVKKEQSKAETLYDDWVVKKDRILQLIASPGYSSIKTVALPASASSDHVRKLLEHIPEGYNVSRENGLYVFAPTLKVYRDFSRFLARVEEIAGREYGVVKIIVPKDSLPTSRPMTAASIAVNTPSGLSSHTGDPTTSNPGPSDSQTNQTDHLLNRATHMTGIDPLSTKSTTNQPSQNLNASSFTMCLHENTQSDIWPVYKIKSESAGTASPTDWLGTIEQHRQFIAQGWNMNEDDKRNAWQAGQWETMKAVTEKGMIESFESGIEGRLYAMDNDGQLYELPPWFTNETDMVPPPASTQLREALGCPDLKLAELPGNSLMKSRSRIAGIHTPYLYVSKSQCTPFAIHIEDYAAYSVNYLHVGAPKCWRVIRPDHHREVEEFLDKHINPPERQLSAQSGRTPRRPPQCTQFLRHHAMYLPKYTMDMLDIEYTTVIQHQGEMVITFPYAYHEGWNTGPNIAEAIGYASERWEIFMREGLYQNCHKLNCRQMPLKMDLGFLRRPAPPQKKSRAQPSGTPRKKSGSSTLPSTTDASATANARTSKLLQPASLYMTPLQTPTPAPSGRNSIDPSSTGLASAPALQHRQRQGSEKGGDQGR
ncbi:MAG: hypothetical protein M1835_000989 [Candelina submexicana]|nr:MAG: hypothetical protein M1835_000989 [Candelina submexicana]